MSTPPLRAHILVIEDDPIQARLYEQAFPYCTFAWARNGSEALELLQQQLPDVILLDHQLGGVETGLDLLPKLKAAATHIPVIMVSGTLAIAHQLRALSGPKSAHYVIEKPVDLDALDASLRVALRECGFGETVESLRSLERAELIETGDRERLFTERLARQHALLNRLRTADDRPNISQLAREFGVDRRSLRRDLQDMVHRGQLSASVLGAADDTV